MYYKQIENCTEWQFKGVPEFKGGVMSELFVNCGAGLSTVSDEEVCDCSFMHLFKDCKEGNVLSYVSELENAGLENIYFNKIDENLFYQFKTDEGMLFVSFLKNSGVARVILDRCSQSCVPDFGYSEFEEKCSDTVFAQYSLHYDKMIKGTTCDCGMNYVYRLRDNSLFIIDGGEMEQATDVAVADYLDFLHTLTNTSAGEKMRISLWLCTHPHNDHCDFMSKLLRFHSDEIIIERAAFDFCFSGNTRHSLSVLLAQQRLIEKFPNVSYIKPHIGSKFGIANAEIEVLVSSEDTVGVDVDETFPGTNDTSVVFKVTADGATTLFLADCAWINGDVLRNNYKTETLKSDFLQAAHHGINNVSELYDCLETKTVLLPQCKMNMDTRFTDVYEHLCGRYGEKNILFANDATDVFTLKDGSVSHEKRAHVGTAYDNSEW